MSVLTIKPSVATLGATVTGAKLNKLSATHWSTIEAAFNEHGVLVFPDQHLSTAEQIDFGRRFGEIAIEASYSSNLLPDGSVRAPDEAMLKTLRGNEYWHTDSSIMPLVAKVSILSAHQVPDSGGETEWADMRAAYDALDDGTRSRMAGLKAYHSVLHAQSRLGQSAEETARMLAELTARHDDEEDTENDKKPVATYPTEPPLCPLVKVHPATSPDHHCSSDVTPTAFPASPLRNRSGFSMISSRLAARHHASSSTAGNLAISRSGTTAVCCIGRDHGTLPNPA